MVEPRQQVEFNGIQYSPVTFEEFAGHTRYSLVGVPRYRWSDKPVAILATFSGRKLTFTRQDFARIDRQTGNFAYLKPPGGGEAGPMMSLGPAFDDAAWHKCKTLWQVYSTSIEGHENPIPRFLFLGTIIFDRKVFRSHYLALDSILFANSHAGDPVLPDPLAIVPPTVTESTLYAAPHAASAVKNAGGPAGLDPGI